MLDFETIRVTRATQRSFFSANYVRKQNVRYYLADGHWHIDSSIPFVFLKMCQLSTKCGL